MADPSDQLVEIVDADGAVIEVVRRARMRAENLRHRNVGVVVVRPDDAVVVHRRADWKDVHPSRWDCVFGGVPAVGESDRDAATRELAEEAGLAVTADDLEVLGAATHDDDHTRWVGRFWMVRTDAVLHPADGEVAELDEVASIELLRWAQATPTCPDMGPVLALLRRRIDAASGG